jgi:hypothetical protein
MAAQGSVNVDAPLVAAMYRKINYVCQTTKVDAETKTQYGQGTEEL